MELYTFKVVLVDTGLPYPNKDEALKDAKEWADDIAKTEMCTVAEVAVFTEDE